MNILAKLRLYIENPEFVIEISHGRSRLVRGAVPAKFIYSCDSISRSHDIEQGCIMGFTKHSRIRLKFFGIPAHLHEVYQSTYP